MDGDRFDACQCAVHSGADVRGSTPSLCKSTYSRHHKSKTDRERYSIPNLPFFYLCFRAYSHYRAWYGGKFLEHLIKKDMVTAAPSQQMDRLYTAGLLHPSREKIREEPETTEAETEQVQGTIVTQSSGGKEEVMLLQRWNGKLIAEDFDLPEMEIEIERAVEQVEQALKKEKEVGQDQKAVEEKKKDV